MAKHDFMFEIRSSADGFDSLTAEFNREDCFYAEGTDLNQFFESLKHFHDWAKEHNETHIHVLLTGQKGFMNFIIPFKEDTSSPFFSLHFAKE